MKIQGSFLTLYIGLILIYIAVYLTKGIQERRIRRYQRNIITAVLFLFLLTGMKYHAEHDHRLPISEQSFSMAEIPAYTDSAYTEVNNNIPFFTEEELRRSEFEEYGELDHLGRCSTAFAMVGLDQMPGQERGSIGMIKPTGWHTGKFDFIEGKYLYNRCHLIAFELTGENANEKNLITGTRYMNVKGMQLFEDRTAWYILRTGNHVLYRSTPVFEGDNLVASGVLLEAFSVEDGGEGICFNVFCYNVQPKVEIDYATGEYQLSKKNK